MKYSSFRDPCGFVFEHQNKIYRQINKSGMSDYEFLISSGLYKNLRESGKIIEHTEEVELSVKTDEGWRVIQPKSLFFVSYPYEWSFAQLKDAALLTLDIQSTALKFGMSLKDASAYNVQFDEGRPILIDTLSFEVFQEGVAWSAYRQFCMHFLAPLCLMAKVDIRLNKLLINFIDGIPLDLSSNCLGWRTWLNPRIFLHIHLHARLQKYLSHTDHSSAVKKNLLKKKVSTKSIVALIDSLKLLINSLDYKNKNSEWIDYYSTCSYSVNSLEEKYQIIDRLLRDISPNGVWDIGANTGLFSRLSASQGIPTVSFDVDPYAVDSNYLMVKEGKETKILPLLMDINNPSPSIGWFLKERHSIISRGPVDCIMALGLIHHIVISNNINLDLLAELFWQTCKNLIVEFIPKSDNQVKRLLEYRSDIFHSYTQNHFENSFNKFFTLKRCINIADSGRIIYWFVKIS